MARLLHGGLLEESVDNMPLQSPSPMYLKLFDSSPFLSAIKIINNKLHFTIAGVPRPSPTCSDSCTSPTNLRREVLPAGKGSADETARRAHMALRIRDTKAGDKPDRGFRGAS